jgi:hypothetical protein
MVAFTKLPTSGMFLGTILMLVGRNKINKPKWDIHLDTENKSYNNKNLMAQSPYFGLRHRALWT